MNKYIKFVLFFVAVFCQLPIYAQSGLTASGIVMSENGETQIGVTVVVKENPGKGSVSDLDGHFKLTGLQANQTLVFSLIGYDKIEMKVAKSDEKMRIVMKERVNELEEAVVVGHSRQRKISVTGAITNVDVKDLKAPATSITNMLGGRVPGIISQQSSGEPGKDFSQFWIRGISTFGAGSSALVLIDGVEGNLNTVDTEDIESFSILKDASATAVYGTRGANGVVLVTTKKGVAGKLSVSLKANYGVTWSPRMPNYVDATTYASLANEANMSRGGDPVYNAVDLALFKNGLDPDLHPNVNWRDVILKNASSKQQYHLSLSGGAQVARYYISLGVLNQEALFKQDQGINKYSTNVNYKQYNFRANVDVNLTKTSILTLGLEDIMVTQNFPGYGNDSQSLWDAQAALTPVTVPLVYTSGQLPAYGPTNDRISPYVLLNYSGFKKYYNNTTKLNLQFQQDLSMITKGLNFTALFNMNANSSLTTTRYKSPALYYALTRKRDGSLALEKKRDSAEPYFYPATTVDRKYYGEAHLNYERVFNKVHRVSGLAHYYMEDYISSTNSTDITAIPKRYMGFSSRLAYAYNDTYFVEGNLGYTGSEAFEKGKKFGFFPAVSAGWVPTQYKFAQDNLGFIDFLKFKGSYGQVGNDKMDNNKRFPYLTLMGYTGSGVWENGNGYSETQVGSSNLRWETSTKTNFGIEAKFFKNKFDMAIDFFKDVRSGIYQQRASTPEEMGLVTLPFANVGKMKSWGVDGHISFTQTINKDAYFVLRANLTQSKNEIIEFEESIVRYPYLSSVGYQWGVNRGLIALGLFKDEADVQNSPKQTFTNSVLPGDIKYKDVNGDGIINDYDRVPLDYSSSPQIQYGFATEFNYKQWNLSVLFEGVGRVKYFSGGTGYYPFADREVGNILDIVAADHWTSREYSGTAATENPNAKFPRLTYGSNNNNNRASTYWLNDASYLRLKNVQLSYKMDGAFMKKAGIKSTTFSVIGENLHVWDKVKIIDPEQASSNGARYPKQRVITLQMNMQF
ncbi:MAG: TonB-dependent receptor [Paludibacter sp.]|nr:TonB-dependent receptor [Paludibacter sp.]